MKTLRSQFHLLGCTNLTHPASNSPAFIPIKAKTQLKHPAYPSRILAKTRNHAATKHEDKPAALLEFTSTKQLLPKSEHSRFVVVGAVSVGIVWFLMAMDDQKALALGPEGPLMEEFWENVRRYGLYALTVSTGALYTIFEPIGELLKNPITAVLILLIFGGSFYVLSQVLSVMLGVSEFSYEYSY
ncbi:hypothetical protein OIU77_029518 [Salix suchowensis]|uniref:Uncharacterized protein ycf33 n=2 Tax=Salix TaxID=40685 RepID=A0A9Q0VG98_9ROSI|nr:hypothetical protein OIU78_003813 [Salix suchowensis]KAJ6380635.1 hypothetical protein OIU77_029518 [Salix suchowensis]KAJ6747771.1 TRANSMEMBRANE PROTEIN [Salix koriyanagi]